MSTKEIHDYVHQQGIITFSDGNKNEGIIIAKYNIAASRIEYFFVPTSKLQEYKRANDSHDYLTLNTLRQPIDITKVNNVQLMN